MPDLRIVILGEESPAEHARNALAILACLQHQSPAFWSAVPELERATRRAHDAVYLLESGAQPTVAVPHLDAAVRALADAPVAWDACPDVGAACARLIHAYFGALRWGWLQ